MTEDEWLASTEPLRMLRHLKADADDRKTLLLTAACLRRLWRLLPDFCRAWAELVEGAAEGRADPNRLNDDWENVESFLGTEEGNGRLAAVLSIAGVGWDDPDVWEGDNRSWRAERKAQAALVRDVFGNPFRSIPFDATWRTPTVKDLAHAAYQERILPGGKLDAVRLGILADALEEAGGGAALLTHLRQPGLHVRGCWVIALLERERDDD